MSVTFKDALGVVVKEVDQTYDVFNRWVRSTLDSNGATSGGVSDRYFVYDGNQILVEFDGAAASDLVNRHTWSFQVDQLLAVEQVPSNSRASARCAGTGLTSASTATWASRRSSTDYLEPQIKLDYALGSGSNPYTGFDRFGRIIDLLW